MREITPGGGLSGYYFRPPLFYRRLLMEYVIAWRTHRGPRSESA